MNLEEILLVFIPSLVSFLPRSQALLDSSYYLQILLKAKKSTRCSVKCKAQNEVCWRRELQPLLVLALGRFSIDTLGNRHELPMDAAMQPPQQARPRLQCLGCGFTQGVAAPWLARLC